MNNRIIRIIVISGMLAIIVFILLTSAIIVFRKISAYKTIITPELAERKVLELAGKYFMPGRKVTISGRTAEESGLYRVVLGIDKNMLPFYLTKDGKSIIFPNGLIEVAKIEEQAKKKQVKDKIPKTDRPSVELFVMSLCPYGVKAEKEILPVISSFTGKLDFKIKYIVTVSGDTLKDVVSLRGADEVKENVRQAAIMQFYPDKFSAYLEKVNEKSCLMSCGAVKIEDYWQEAAGSLKIDTKKIESFAYGQEGIELLKQNEADVKKYSVEASPTLIINGVKSNSIFDGEKAMRKATCSAFTVAPNECQGGIYE